LPAALVAVSVAPPLEILCGGRGKLPCSGRSQTRPPLSAEQIRANGETYMEQAFKILGEKRMAVRHDGERLGSMSMGDTLLPAREMAVAQSVLLFSGASHCIGWENVERKLKEGKTLAAKLGVDPTRPDWALGRMVVFGVWQKIWARKPNSRCGVSLSAAAVLIFANS
jgi:tyrosyl-tRNA synthetase